ncbi:hypothetical protein TraAM80_04336 [Trypanosoma rangeli]|uniref:Uncharacterized protein n=1 Tax=Trypanosoma rangeli TaxID=5698 RepID=A0A3R7NFJ5_TRYRA|nr:uncharacterized protein TraAM80_04336 [Trypanosoma rangeli]RNF05803.1 hypothetical protein TraAM80_04336 [Trypanosoma rangeli]|eukprot:RNF05803.1 hypothetical protein TraAM80_04336 [Trypanosoma rangeli]
MQLCYCCRHAFPTSSLAPCVFSDIIAHRFEEVHKIVEEMDTTTPEETHRIAQLQMALRELHSAVHQEINALKERKASLEAARQRDRDRQELELGVQPRTVHLQCSSALSNTQPMGYNLSRSNYPKIVPRASFNGTVPTYKLRKMNSALELVSASIYSVMESLAIRTRASVAMLWILPPGVVSTELVAPFVVGRDMSKLWNTAPYRVSENSIPCLVSEEGIALNFKPKPGIGDKNATENTPILELMELPNTAQLMVPVFTRYGEVQRTVLGVVHLIGNPLFPCPFGLRNEEMAVQTASTLSVILSSYYETMGGEWANRIYDPSVLISTSAYQGKIDMRSMDKIYDDFPSPSTLIYRCKNEKKEEGDSRDVIKALRYAMTRRAVPRETVWSVKDMHRFAKNMEQNWIFVLNANTEMETKLASLEDKVLRCKMEKEYRQKGSRHDLSSSTANNSLSVGRPTITSLTSVVTLPLVPERKKVLKPEEVSEIEITALRRLQNMGVDTAPFQTTNEA